MSCGPANNEPERAELAPTTFHWITWGTQSEYEFTRFVREPHDADRFIQTLEEVRQKMVDQGLLYPEEE
jgi:hypothetical protein